VTGTVETDTETERNYSNGKEIDDCKKFNEKISFSRHGWAFALDREPSNG
jgi:hypothetical protein